MSVVGRIEKIGQVLKSNGTDGQVVIRIFDIDAFEALDLNKEPVFVYFDGLPVPFFLSSVRWLGSSKVLAFLTGVNCLDDADEMAGRDVFLSHSDRPLSQGDFIGWRLFRAVRKTDVAAEATSDSRVQVGVVADIEDIPGNPCLKVQLSSGDVSLIPFHRDLVVKVDEIEKSLTMIIPEGLL